jgi:hypothetical protein
MTMITRVTIRDDGQSESKAFLPLGHHGWRSGLAGSKHPSQGYLVLLRVY